MRGQKECPVCSTDQEGGASRRVDHGRSADGQVGSNKVVAAFDPPRTLHSTDRGHSAWRHRRGGELSDPAGAIRADQTSGEGQGGETRLIDHGALPVVRCHASSRERRNVLLLRHTCRPAGAMGVARDDNADRSLPDSPKTRHPIPRHGAALSSLPGTVPVPLPMRFVSSDQQAEKRQEIRENPRATCG